jgi:hypothetical protein
MVTSVSEDSTTQPEPAPLRASNADRERVAKILNQAESEGRLDLHELQERLDIVYGAKTLAELEPVTRDLPGHSAAVVARPAVNSVPTPAPAPAASRIGGGWTSTTAVAVMSGSERKGEWVVPPRFTAVAIMGGVELDLTQAKFGAAEVVITATAIMGGIEITVPDDVTVHCGGIGIMGGFTNKASNLPIPGAPVIRINGFALMGGVDVKVAKPKKKLSKG